MSDESPIVADGPDRLRRAVAALPPEERREAERRLELEGRAWWWFRQTRVSRWPLLAPVARWVTGWPRGPLPADQLPVDHRCYLDASSTEAALRGLDEGRQ